MNAIKYHSVVAVILLCLTSGAQAVEIPDDASVKNVGSYTLIEIPLIHHGDVAPTHYRYQGFGGGDWKTEFVVVDNHGRELLRDRLNEPTGYVELFPSGLYLAVKKYNALTIYRNDGNHLTALQSFQRYHKILVGENNFHGVEVDGWSDDGRFLKFATNDIDVVQKYEFDAQTESVNKGNRIDFNQPKACKNIFLRDNSSRLKKLWNFLKDPTGEG